MPRGGLLNGNSALLEQIIPIFSDFGYTQIESRRIFYVKQYYYEKKTYTTNGQKERFPVKN